MNTQDETQMLDAVSRWLERDVRPKVRELEKNDTYPDAMVQTTVPDGTKTETTVKKDEIAWRDPLSHTVENIGRTDLHALLVELKRR